MTVLTKLPQNAHVLRRFIQHPSLRFIVPLLIMALAFLVLNQMSRDINLADVKADARAYPFSVLAVSFGAMCISYLALSLYDVIILRDVSNVHVPLAVKMMTGIAGMAVSNMLGFSWLTGGAIRYRVYAAFGVDISAVARLIATSWVAFFFGLLILMGGLMALYPNGLGDILPLSGPLEILIGFSILIAATAYFIWTAKVRRVVGVGAFSLNLPLARDGLQMTMISIVDMAASAITLYVLMPPDLAQNFVVFFVVFVAAVGLGILSHSPGGLGVFEATVVVAMGATGRSDVLTALMMYRVIYTVLPFLLVVIGLVLAWLIANKKIATEASKTVFRAITPVVPLLAAAMATLSGSVLLISGNLPSDPGRLSFLSDILPLTLVETSHLLASISGVMLLIVARGLYRRMFRAWLLAITLLATGIALSLLKGFDWEEALTMAVSFVVLWVFRKAFYRAEVAGGLRLNLRWILSVTLLVGVISWIGFFAYRNVEYTDALWWEFAWKGDASRFLRATLAVAVILAAMILNALLSKQSTRLKHEPIPDVVRRLTATATTAQAGISLSGDKRFIVTQDQRAYIAYADTGHTLVSKGDPVGDKDACATAIWQLRELADKMGRRCAFYSISERFLPNYLDLGLQVLKIGEVARVNLGSFSLDGPRRKDWRYARARLVRDGYEFVVLKSKDHTPEILAELNVVSDAWLLHKNSEEKGFSLGWFHPDYVSNFDIAALRNVETGNIIAFANLLQAGDKSEISLDLMRYDPTGPNLAMDALFAEMMIWGQDQGFEWFSLGAAPLSGFENHRLAPTWHRLGSFLYEHGELFYHFEGLRSFKEKFDPEWSPEYLASSGSFDAARVLYEVSLLVSRGVKGMKKH